MNDINSIKSSYRDFIKRLSFFSVQGGGERIPGIKAVQKYKKLMVLGKPGSGKTTFLKYLALQCNKGYFFENLVPIFITLKDYSENEDNSDLLSYIGYELFGYELREFTLFLSSFKKVLNSGRALILLDGLDEVRPEKIYTIKQEVSKFTELYFNNHIIITCRIAAINHSRSISQNFVNVEIADFGGQQISSFVRNWFKSNDIKKAGLFINKIKNNDRILELTTNPLLLTLLCLVFDEKADFPTSRSQLYEEGTELLLAKWDSDRDIQRNCIYQDFSIVDKEGFLSYLAFNTFKNNQNFFNAKVATKIINNYLNKTAYIDLKYPIFKEQCKSILESVELQHGLLIERARGIYSFSHLTFHEYFTALEIVNCNLENYLVEYVDDFRWREVFILVNEMLEDSSSFITFIRDSIEKIDIYDTEFDSFLSWLKKKTDSCNSRFEKYILRSIYIEKILSCTTNIDRGFELTISVASSKIALAKMFDKPFSFAKNPMNANAASRALIEALGTKEMEIDFLIIDIFFLMNKESNSLYSLSYSLRSLLEQLDDSDFKKEIYHLYKKLPSEEVSRHGYSLWWANERHKWIQIFKVVVDTCFNLSYCWQFPDNDSFIDNLERYIYANKLLVDCINSDCNLSQDLQDDILNSLFLSGDTTANR